MTTSDAGAVIAMIATPLLLVGMLALCRKPLGDHMARTYASASDLRAERFLYRIARIDPRSQQTWYAYAASVLGFSAASVYSLYLLQRLQGVLPALGASRPAVEPSMAFNTAVSFVTNTNWQSYSGEATLTNLTQAAGLAVQNFVSAAVGMAVAVALFRAIAGERGGTIGNFWVDLVRGCTRILLPIAFAIAVVFVLGGMLMSFGTTLVSTGFDGIGREIALAPVASHEAIKLLGTNGGGIYGANSAHPFENPTAWTNLVSVCALLLIPVALTRTYGTMVEDQAQGLALVGVMATLWTLVLVVVLASEHRLTGVAARAAGAMAEGKEWRLGTDSTVIFAVSTTGTSTGAVDSMHDSFSPLGGGMLILNMLFGEVAPGGVGTGMYGLLVLAVIAVFIGGLLVGRTPEFLGKKIGRREITFASLTILVMPALVLAGTAISMILPATRDAQANSGPAGSLDSIHGYSEVLYAFTSASNNNGSAFAGLTVTSDWFQASLASCMWLGRLLPIIFVLGLAGSLMQQRRIPAGEGTLPTRGLAFGALLVGVILLVAALTFFPALALGPLAEALQ